MIDPMIIAGFVPSTSPSLYLPHCLVITCLMVSILLFVKEQMKCLVTLSISLILLLETSLGPFLLISIPERICYLSLLSAFHFISFIVIILSNLVFFLLRQNSHNIVLTILNYSAVAFSTFTVLYNHPSI